MLRWKRTLQEYVSNISDVYVQLFRMNVAKIDRDIAYVTMVVHICCKRLFPMFHLFFRRILQVCLSWCYICFTYTYMLQVFYPDVAYVCNDFQVFSCVFAIISDACFKYFICLRTYVTSVASGCFKSRSGITHCFKSRSDITHVVMWSVCCSRWREGWREGSGRAQTPYRVGWGRRHRVGSGEAQTPCKVRLYAECRHGNKVPTPASWRPCTSTVGMVKTQPKRTPMNPTWNPNWWTFPVLRFKVPTLSRGKRRNNSLLLCCKWGRLVKFCLYKLWYIDILFNLSLRNHTSEFLPIYLEKLFQTSWHVCYYPVTGNGKWKPLSQSQHRVI
jgi:hypothetical protein